MPIDFDLSEDLTVNTLELEDVETNGIDVRLEAGQFSIGPDGDLLVVSGVGMLRQSVLREIPVPPGGFPRRPSWGMGVSGQLFKGNTETNRRKTESRIRGRLIANQLVKKINEVTVFEGEETGDLRIRVDVSGLDSSLSQDVVVRPPRVL